jgi:hypothetical protein
VKTLDGCTYTGYSSYMHTTTAQNMAHRGDVAWIKSAGRNFKANGETFISEYVNPWTGQAIRKSWKMTGADWFIFDAVGNVTGRSHSLTWAKMDAAA